MANRTKNQEATLVAEIDQTLAAIQALSIRIPDPADVREYLLEHSDLQHRLFQVCEMTHEKFIGRGQIVVVVYKDPEFDDQHLTLYVRPKNYELDLIDEIDAVQEEAAPILRGSSERILITTDYRLPE